MTVQAIRAKAKAETKVGPAEVIQCAVPLIEAPDHIKAAQTATREANAAYLTVMLEGKYTDDYLKQTGNDAPIASPLDFVGINVYKPAFYALASDQAPGWRAIPFARLQLAITGPRDDLLCPEVRAVAVGREGDLHYRERLRQRRRRG
jgi:beta-glucosidase